MLELQPITIKEANEFIRKHHSHHLPPQGWKFGLAVSRPVNIEELEKQLIKQWSRDTSFAPNEWTPKNPAFGQCATTSLIVQDIYGGKLLRAEIENGSHYYNQLDNNQIVDLTISQFKNNIKYSNVESRDREYLLSFEDTVTRYEILKSRIIYGIVVGVITIGRPVARFLDDNWTLEVTRCCTDRTKNVASMLYGAARKAVFALGYRKLITYTLKTEKGTSLKAAGWKIIGERGGGSWSVPSRPRVDKHPLQKKILWEAPSVN